MDKNFDPRGKIMRETGYEVLDELELQDDHASSTPARRDVVPRNKR